MEGIANWNRFSREARISMLVGRRGVSHPCPACGRVVDVVQGYWLQHTDPASWSDRHPRQCLNELTPFLKEPDHG